MMNVSAMKDIIVYAIFPGQQIFLEVFHPQKSFKNVELNGIKTYLITISPEYTVHLPEKGDCFIKGDGLEFTTQAHLQYKNWYFF